MLKEVYYTYLGTNGTITSKVHLEDVYYIRKIKLIADDGKYLTNGEKKVKTILVPEEEVELWHEEFGQI
jgi:hypothetical protein